MSGTTEQRSGPLGPDGSWRVTEAGGGVLEVRRVQPYQATKSYSCPGCNQEIARGVGHIAAVPVDAPDLRRHWHRGCFDARDRRRPGRS